MLPEEPDNPHNKRLKPASLAKVLKEMPGLGAKQGIALGLVSFKNEVDSSNVSYQHWLAMGRVISEHYKEFDGFVVLHGTDTMAFTSSVLSFILTNLAKPVVITGSQLPISHPRTDAKWNLVNAIYLAGYKATGLHKIPEVVICFANQILRGNRATKYSSSQMQGFRSPNFPPLGTIGEHIEIRKDLCKVAPNNEEQELESINKLANDVKVIYVNPGMTPHKLKRDLSTEGIDGVIVLTYGAGNMQSQQAYLDIIREAVIGAEGYSKPIPVLNVTQCQRGMVEMGLYEASSGLLEAGVASGLDMTFEAALGKMYWALAQIDPSDIRNQLQLDKRGEQSHNLHDIHWRPTANLAMSAVEAIRLEGRNVPGRYKAPKLQNAVLRIQGMGVQVEDKKRDFFIKIYLNLPHADLETHQPKRLLATIIDTNAINEMGNYMVNITQNAKNVIVEGDPVNLTIVCSNAKVWCRSVYLSLYTAAN